MEVTVQLGQRNRQRNIENQIEELARELRSELVGTRTGIHIVLVLDGLDEVEGVSLSGEDRGAIADREIGLVRRQVVVLRLDTATDT